MTGHHLLLLRHAKSGWGENDHERPLDARGRDDAALLAAHLAAGPAPDLILSSSALRARQTLDILLAAFQPPPRTAVEQALYLAPPQRLARRIAATPEGVGRLLLIGHNPGLHELAQHLAGSGPARLRQRLADGLPTAALATFSIAGPWAKLGAAGSTLIALVTPADLAEGVRGES